MYSMVLMAAMAPAGDTAGFGKKSHGCDGGAGCTGAVVVDAGCSGSGAGCTGGSKHFGGGLLGGMKSGCSGGGFLGGRGGCSGGGGFFSKHHKSNGCSGGCHGGDAGAGCHGGTVTYSSPATTVPECAVVPGSAVPSTTTTPDAMPKMDGKKEMKPETPVTKPETPKVELKKPDTTIKPEKD